MLRNLLLTAIVAGSIGLVKRTMTDDVGATLRSGGSVICGKRTKQRSLPAGTFEV